MQNDFEKTEPINPDAARAAGQRDPANTTAGNGRNTDEDLNDDATEGDEDDTNDELDADDAVHEGNITGSSDDDTDDERDADEEVHSQAGNRGSYSDDSGPTS